MHNKYKYIYIYVCVCKCAFISLFTCVCVRVCAYADVEIRNESAMLVYVCMYELVYVQHMHGQMPGPRYIHEGHRGRTAMCMQAQGVHGIPFHMRAFVFTEPCPS